MFVKVYVWTKVEPWAPIGWTAWSRASAPDTYASSFELIGAPTALFKAVAAMQLPRWAFFAMIFTVLLIIAYALEELSVMIIILPILFPLVTGLGFDPIWFGVLSMMMVSMGLVFPPVGLIAFVVSATAGVDLVKVYTGTSILMLAIVITTALIMVFPEIVLWLPARMR